MNAHQRGVLTDRGAAMSDESATKHPTDFFMKVFPWVALPAIIIGGGALAFAGLFQH